MFISGALCYLPEYSVDCVKQTRCQLSPARRVADEQRAVDLKWPSHNTSRLLREGLEVVEGIFKKLLIAIVQHMPTRKPSNFRTSCLISLRSFSQLPTCRL